MATRSDFAQKLLNDLRMRKERMGAGQSSSHSSRMAGVSGASSHSQVFITTTGLRKNGSLRNSRPPKHQILILQGVKQKRLDKTSSSKGTEQMSSSLSNEATTRNRSPEESETSVKLQNVALPQNKEGEHAPKLYSFAADERQSQSITQLPTRNESCQSKASATSTVPIASQYQAPIFIEGQELESLETASSPLNGADGGNTEISYLSPHEHKEILTPEPQELLTEKEINLKKILIKSQLFLNTAEALFKLDISFDILPATP